MDAIKRNRLLIGAVVLLAMGGLAVWVVQTKSGDTKVVAEDTPTLPEIDRDAITEIEIGRPDDDDRIKLVKDGEDWRLAAPVEAPAAKTNVDTVLDKLADLEVEGVASRNAQFHERLEVDEAQGVHVIARAGGDEVINFWIGGVRSRNTMVRLDGHDPTLMVKGSIKFAFNKPARDFRDRTIASLEAGDVTEASFTNENGAFRFRKGDDGWAQVLEAAEGEAALVSIERFDASKVGSAVSSIASLRASDFAAPDVDAASAGLGEGAARVVLTSADETLTLRIGNEVDEGSRYVMREGDETIFIVSRFMAERLVPSAETFQAPEPGEEPEPAAPPPGMPGMPGMGGMPGAGGGGQIPPELMEQIQRQLQQQGIQADDGHGH